MSIAAEIGGFRAPRWLKRHETVLAVILVIALIGLGAFNDRFLTLDNLLNQGRLMTEIGLIALPMTFVIITGGIDLSVGAVVGLCAIMLGYSWKTFGFPLPLAIAFSLLVGALAGFVNGLVITRLKVPPLIMTIATLALYRGLAEGVSQAHSVRGYPEWFYFLGQGSVAGVPTQLWLLLIGIVVSGIVLDRTTFGRTLYAIGANETAARFSARPVDRVKLIVYTLSGLTAGLSACRPRVARDDDADGHGRRLRARRHRGCRARRHEHFRRLGHDLGHGHRAGDDPAPEERLGVDGRQGRRDNRRYRRGAHSFGHDCEFPRASPRVKRAPSGGQRRHRRHSREELEMKAKLLATTAAAMFALAFAAGGANAASKWDGADDLPTNPLACDASPARALAAAKPYDGGQATNPPDKAGKEITLVDVPKLIGIGYFNATSKGMQDAAKELGNVKVTTDGPTEAKIDEQIKFIDNYITRGVDGVLFAANDPVAIAPVLKKALSKGIHVVGYDANSTPDAREWFVNQAEFNGIRQGDDRTRWPRRSARTEASRS